MRSLTEALQIVTEMSWGRTGNSPLVVLLLAAVWAPKDGPQVRQAQGKTLTGLSVWEVSMRGLPSSMSGFFVFLSRCTISSACPFHCNVILRKGKPPSRVPLAWLHSVETGT